MKTFSTEDVYKFLPHRPPFLFVDEIISLECPADPNLERELDIKEVVGSKIVGKFKITDELEILKGHFPGNPILPGVVQVEMMAQTACFLNYLLFEKDKALEDMKFEIRLVGVDKARFRKPITPGMDLDVKVEVVRVRGGFSNYVGEIYCGDELLCDASILANFEKTN